MSCVVGFQDNEEVMEGIMCVYSCEESYDRVGPEVLLCGEGGVWLGREVRWSAFTLVSRQDSER